MAAPSGSQPNWAGPRFGRAVRQFCARIRRLSRDLDAFWRNLKTATNATRFGKSTRNRQPIRLTAFRKRNEASPCCTGSACS